MTDQYIDIVFDGPPSHESGRFVEVEDEHGRSIAVGEWIDPATNPDAKQDDDWRLRIPFHQGMNMLADAIHQNAVVHGFWPQDRQRALEALNRIVDVSDADAGDVALAEQYVHAQPSRNIGEMLMLAVSELSEALEEHREGKSPHYHILGMDLSTRLDQRGAEALANIRHGVSEAQEVGELEQYEPEPDDIRVLVEAGIAKPEGVAVEIIDCIIRCLDTLRHPAMGNIDIDALVREKMAYNASRPPKHGKAY